MDVDTAMNVPYPVESEEQFDAESETFVAEIDTWSRCLPEGIASLTVTRTPGTDVAIDLYPRRVPDAPPIRILLTWDELQIWVDGQWVPGEGIRGGMNTAYALAWDETLDAIIQGRVTRTRYRRNGRVILDKLEVRARDGTRHTAWRSYSALGLFAPSGLLARIPGVIREVTDYPPYT